MSVIVNPRDIMLQGTPPTGRIVPVELPPNVIIPGVTPDLTTPPTPDGFNAVPSFSNVLISHNVPTFTVGHGYKLTKLYGALSDENTINLPTFAEANLLDSFIGIISAYATTPGLRWHFWITWVSNDDKESLPAGGPNGKRAQTGIDVERVVALMTGIGSPFKEVKVGYNLPDGTYIPPGTYTSDAYIHNGFIKNAMIGLLAVDDGNIVKLNVGKLVTGTLQVGTSITSANYVQNSQGFLFRSSDGFIEANNALFRGTVYATAGEMRGITIKDSDGNVLLSSRGKTPDSWKTKNLLKVDTWVTGHDSAPGFNRNGGVYESYRGVEVLPDGSRGLVWVCYPGLYVNNAYGWDNPLPLGEGAGDADGGWNSDNFEINSNKAYRFHVYIKRYGGTSGTSYLGCGGGTVRDLGNGPVNQNPYFYYGQPPIWDRWYLAVGYVYPANYVGVAQTNLGGLWDCVTGQKITQGTDYAWVDGITFSVHRAYLFYSAPRSQQLLAWPGVHLMDGTEPNLDSLLSMSAISARNPLSPENASTYIRAAAIDSAHIKDLAAEKIRVGTLYGQTLVAGQIIGGRIDGTLLNGVNLYANVGQFEDTMAARRISVNSPAGADVGFCEVAYPNNLMNSWASSRWYLSTVVGQAIVTTSDLLFANLTAGWPIEKCIRKGTILFTVMANATVYDKFAIWFRVNGGGWQFLSQTSSPSVDACLTLALSWQVFIGQGGSVQIGVSATDSGMGTIAGGGAYLTNCNVTVLAKNL